MHKSDIKEVLEIFLDDIKKWINPDEYKYLLEYCIEGKSLSDIAKDNDLSRSAIHQKVQKSEKIISLYLEHIYEIKNGCLVKRLINDESSLYVLRLNAITYNCLNRNGVETIGELRGYHIPTLMSFKGMGPKAFKDLINKLESVGINPKEFFSKDVEGIQYIGTQGLQKMAYEFLL